MWSGAFRITTASSRATVSCSVRSPLASTSILSGTANGVTPSSSSTRSYISRAHPKPRPEFPIIRALQMTLEGTQERILKREKKWERNAPVRVEKGLKVSLIFWGTYSTFPFSRSSFSQLYILSTAFPSKTLPVGRRTLPQSGRND